MMEDNLACPRMEAPRRRVIRVGGLVGGVKSAKAEAHPAEPDLDGEA